RAVRSEVIWTIFCNNCYILLFYHYLLWFNMQWQANQLMRDDLAKCSKTHLSKKFYNNKNDESIEPSSPNETLYRPHSQLKMDDFLTFPDSQLDGKQSRDIIGVAEKRLSKEDLTEAWQCQARVRRFSRQRVSRVDVEETIDNPTDAEINQVTESALGIVHSESIEEKVFTSIEFEKVQKEHTNYREENKNLKLALQRTADEYAQLHQQNKGFQSEIQSLKNARDESTLKYESELTKLRKQCGLAQQQIKELHLEVEQGVRTLKEKFNDEQAMSAEKNETLTKELDSKSSLANSLKEEVEHLTLKVKQGMMELDKKNEKLSVVSVKAEDLETKLQHRNIEIRRRAEEISFLMKNEKKMSESVQKHQTELELKEKQLNKFNSTNNVLLKQRDERKQECIRKDEEIAKLKAKLQKYVESIKNEKTKVVKGGCGEEEKVKSPKKKNKKKRKKSKSNIEVCINTKEGGEACVKDACAEDITKCETPSQEDIPATPQKDQSNATQSITIDNEFDEEDLSNENDHENVHGWWKIFVMLFALIALVFCFFAYESQGLYEVTTIFENVFGLLTGGFMEHY
uniref:Uncharacterized protein n=1 Tax=Clytia hemisphaerica TaxID=252671 RepID=A0A7M5UES1_9CNID